ncbi:hypothetical protein TUBRATIS_003100 [Tubulinosema ratisbonensis]|uniref:Uncharacterized protein n=1 Tax=Tubulinosema ratisbonensis TaxID=291195 RepID=A0A437AQA9_9MICR|nr:hypothetical protein TUBRATIS_003100 [Tubulinosema ratisbonensis]
MDRINAFLRKRKQKNKKIIKVKDKEYELTRDDIKKVKRYMNNECLDENVELYQPMNTTYSKNVRETPILSVRKRVVKKISKIKIKKSRKEKKIKKEIWDDFDTIDMDMDYKCELYDEKMAIDELNSPIENFNRILAKMVQKYFRSQGRKKVIDNKKIEIGCNFPKNFAKKYDIDNVILQKNGLILYKNEENFEIFDLNLSNTIRRLKKLNYNSFYFYKNELFYSLDNKIYKSDDLNDTLIYEHSDQITKIAIEEENIAFISNKNVVIIDLNTKKETILRKKSYLDLEFKNKHLFTPTTENLRSFSLQNRKYSKFGRTVQTWNKGKFLILGDQENLILYDNDIKKVMDQTDYIREVRCHEKMPIFCCVLKNELRIFYYKEGSVKLCTIIKESFKNVFFHNEFPFLYGITNGNLALYTF